MYLPLENLAAAMQAPVELVMPNRVVYSPHVYGPGPGHEMAYFSGDAYPRNLPEIWRRHFAGLADAGRTVVVGEWGGLYDGENKVWMDAFAPLPSHTPPFTPLPTARTRCGWTRSPPS